MAKQKGIIKLEGTLGDITFVKTQDGYLAKERTSVNAKRIASDPAFQRTRENNAEFGRAGQAGKVLRQAIRSLLQSAQDNRMVSRLTATMLRVVQADATSTRGQRTILDGETELLEGFDFNLNAPFGSTFFADHTVSINRVTGALSVSIPPFVPNQMVAAPSGTTHFKIISGGSAIDFENSSFVTDLQESNVLPWNAAATVLQTLSPSVPAASTHPIFLLTGIVFYQEVNGSHYPLKNGAYNSLCVRKVSGV